MPNVTMHTVAKAIGADADLVKEEQALIDARADLYHCADHEVRFDTVDGTFSRTLRSLRLGKRVPEDWAGLLWTENSAVLAGEEDSAEQVYLDTVLGPKRAPLLAEAIERAFGLGTCGVDLLWDYKVDWLGRVKRSRYATPVLDVTDAYGVIPLSWDKTGVSEVAFVSYGDKDVYVREHRAEGIYNKRWEIAGSSLIPAMLPEGIAEFVPVEGRTFALIRPSIASSGRVGHPYGISVLDSAQDHIRTADLCFDNFGEDFALGGKKVFVSESLLKKDSGGNFQAPDRTKRQMYLPFRDPVGEGEFSTGITEYNPKLRVEDNAAGIDLALGLVSQACGFGEGHYRFEGSEGLKTAKEVVSQHSELYRTRRKHFLAVAAALEDVARAALVVGSEYGGLSLDISIDIKVVSDDSVIEDDQARVERGMSYFQAGAISQKRFLVEYLHMTEEEAEAEIAESAPSIPGLV